jgi:hypothetical protein
VNSTIRIFAAGFRQQKKNVSSNHWALALNNIKKWNTNLNGFTVIRT